MDRMLSVRRLAGLSAALVLGAAFPLSVCAAAELAILEPAELVTTTTRARIRVVGSTDPGAVTTATVAGTSVPVSRSGRFVREAVPLAIGRNTIPVVVAAPDGTLRNERILEVNRVAKGRDRKD